jgi:hypothetical protein
MARDSTARLIHTSHCDKKQGTIRSIAVVRSCGFEERILIDHNNEETFDRSRQAAGRATDHPNTKMDERAGRPAELQKRTDHRNSRRLGHQRSAQQPKTVAAMREGTPTTIRRIVGTTRRVLRAERTVWWWPTSTRRRARPVAAS